MRLYSYLFASLTSKSHWTQTPIFTTTIEIPPIEIPPIDVPPIEIPPIDVPTIEIPPIEVINNRSTLHYIHRGWLSLLEYKLTVGKIFPVKYMNSPTSNNV